MTPADGVAWVMTTAAVIVWLLCGLVCLVEVRRDQRHRRHARLRVLAQRRQHRALDHEEQHNEADDGTDEGEEKFHAPSVSTRAPLGDLLVYEVHRMHSFGWVVTKLCNGQPAGRQSGFRNEFEAKMAAMDWSEWDQKRATA